jgi:hypothetical protein
VKILVKNVPEERAGRFLAMPFFNAHAFWNYLPVIFQNATRPGVPKPNRGTVENSCRE